MDLHFLYQAKIEFYYHNRYNEMSALSMAIDTGKQQIAISDKVKKIFIDEWGFLPAHVGY